MPVVNISLQPKQLEAHLHIANLDSAPYLLYGGAKGGGKSHLDRENEFIRRMEFPGTKGLIIRKTYDELYENHIQPMFRDHPETFNWYNQSKKQIVYPGGSTTSFKYLQYTRDVYNYQGLEYDDIKLDEATQHDEEVFKVLKTSLRSNPEVVKRLERGGKKFKKTFLLTGNPGGVGHGWVKRLFIDRKFGPREDPADYDFIQAKVHDNPLLIETNPDYLQNLYDLPDDLRRAYLDGDWDVFAGQFFSEWRKHIHVVNPFEIPQAWPKWAGIDWGYDPHPFTIGCYTMDIWNQPYTVYKYREIEGTMMSPKEVGQLFLDMPDFGQFQSVPADFQMWAKNPFATSRANEEAYTDKSIAIQIQSMGVPLIQANKARVNGWTNVRSMLKWEYIKPDGTIDIKEPRFKVFETCPKTIDGYPIQIHSATKPGDLEKKDGDDHQDTDRYTLFHISEQPVNEKSNKVNKVLSDGNELLFTRRDMQAITLPNQDETSYMDC